MRANCLYARAHRAEWMAPWYAVFHLYFISFRGGSGVGGGGGRCVPALMCAVRLKCLRFIFPIVLIASGLDMFLLGTPYKLDIVDRCAFKLDPGTPGIPHKYLRAPTHTLTRIQKSPTANGFRVCVFVRACVYVVHKFIPRLTFHVCAQPNPVRRQSAKPANPPNEPTQPTTTTHNPLGLPVNFIIKIMK